MKFVSKIASPADDDTETHLVLKEMIKANKDMFIKSAESAGIAIMP